MISLTSLFEISPEHVVTPDPNINGKFLVHFHQARKAGDHWDIRLGHDGALVSWATKKLPELIDEDVKKIMLFKQPDHNPDWFDFRGEITDGYGAGNVNIYDKGKYDILKWEKNIITVDLKGTKMKGIYTFLFYGENQWLLFKSSRIK